jgi:hypothetical protein
MSGAPARTLSVVGGALPRFREKTGRSLAVWAIVALLQFGTQIIFRRQLAPGEFATLNTLLGLLGLLAVPIFALGQALTDFQPADANPERLALLKKARLPLIFAATIVWTFLGGLLLLLILEALRVPRFSLASLMLPSLVFALGFFVSEAFYEEQNRLRIWSGLLVLAAAVRLLAAGWMTASLPWAETGLAAGWFAGLVALTPLLRQAKIEVGWKKARTAWRDRGFRFHFAATLSAVLGIFLFSSADRIAAQAWFGRAEDNNMGLVHWGFFDGYQTAGLVGRALLWGTQPLLLLLAAERVRHVYTTAPVRNLFWIYIVILVAGAVSVSALAQPLSLLFGGGDAEATAHFIPPFALALMPAGLLQGVGVFALASRRHPECFVLGGSGLAYTLFIFLFGRPLLMLACVFGGGLVALMLLLFVGVVRWGRRQP